MNQFIKDIFKVVPHLKHMTIFAHSGGAELVMFNFTTLKPRSHKLKEAIKEGTLPEEFKSFLVEHSITLDQLMDILCSVEAVGPSLNTELKQDMGCIALFPNGGFKKVNLRKK